MTALAGYWSFGGDAGARRRCETMLRAQDVYAPGSAARIEAAGEIGLGRKLHRLLPEDAFDRGPIVDADGRVLVADVRIDNRAELCRALELGDAARLPDAAILGHALARWEEDALDHVVGDYAFAHWDPRRRRLLLARDFLGQRPLHYHLGDGFIAFASMPKGLHALAEIPRAADRDAAADFLAHIPESGEASFFEGVAKVAPGHFVVATPNGVASHRYWHPAPQPLRLASAEDYAQGLREQLDRAVSSRLRGTEGGVATHLSGGLDSSAVTATAARLSAGRVTAYTSVPREGFVVPPDQRGIADEGPLAAAVAGMYANIDHLRIRAGARSPLAALGRNAFLYERPYLNLCNGVWVDAINDDARARGLTVLLVGAVGNAGFSYHGMHRLPQMLRRGALFGLTRESLKLLREGIAASTLASQIVGPFLPRGVWRGINRLRGRADDLTGYSAISQNGARDPRLAARAAERGADFAYQPSADARAAQLWLLGRVDFGNYYKGTLGGWGIDVRDPSADRRLVEYCLSVPADQYLRDGVPRALARRALADRLPPSVTSEMRKGYQGADWHEGLAAARGQLADEIAHIARDPGAADLVDTDRLRGLLDDWPSGSWQRDEVVETYRLALLRGISIGHFMRLAAGTN